METTQQAIAKPSKSSALRQRFTKGSTRGRSARGDDGARAIGRVARIISLLVHDGPLSYEELGGEARVAYTTIQKWIRAMRKEGLVHISGYTERTGLGGQPKMLFAWGPGKDARRPKRTDAEIARAYRAKKRAIEQIRRMAGSPVQDDYDAMEAWEREHD